MKLLVSYVSAGGDLGSLDTSCVGEVPAFNLTVPLAYQHYFLSTGNVYDGIYDASLSTTELSGGSSKEGTSYKAAFLVFLVLFVVALALAAFFLYRWYKLKCEKPSGRASDDLPEQGEISTAPAVGSSSPELVSSFTAQRVK
ncbi:hypothetical protein PRNP1_003603 [Phytophthora ramorum]